MKSKASASRRRLRRPRFLSLRRQLTIEADEQNKQKAAAMMSSPPPAEEGNVADRFFAGVEGCANTLTGLLQPEEEESAAADSPMSSVSAAYNDGRSLVRAAMRSHREEEEVRWVRMSEVQVSDEVSSRAAAEEGGGGGGGGGLALKLDYKEVEEAWDGCGKGRPFFSWPDSASAGEGPQIVPDLRVHNDFFYHHHQLNGANGVLWGVPDHNHGMEDNGEQSIEGWRLGQREASVLRYKEKRMNRLFSKRIRYQVRKLNADKRPRVKGRFVKRS